MLFRSDLDVRRLRAGPVIVRRGTASRTKRGSGGTALSCASTPVAASLSTEELLEQVWDENADPFTNTVFNTLSAVFGDLIPIRTVGKTSTASQERSGERE